MATYSSPGYPRSEGEGTSRKEPRAQAHSPISEMAEELEVLSTAGATVREGKRGTQASAESCPLPFILTLPNMHAPTTTTTTTTTTVFSLALLDATSTTPEKTSIAKPTSTTATATTSSLQTSQIPTKPTMSPTTTTTTTRQPSDFRLATGRTRQTKISSKSASTSFLGARRTT